MRKRQDEIQRKKEAWPGKAPIRLQTQPAGRKEDLKRKKEQKDRTKSESDKCLQQAVKRVEAGGMRHAWTRVHVADKQSEKRRNRRKQAVVRG